MGGSIPIIQGHAHILRDKVDATVKYRWNCSCPRKGTFPPQTGHGQWHRQVLTVLESFRQHWNDVHKGQGAPPWDFITNRVAVWAIQPPRDDEGCWIAPSGKRPAVASDYYVTPQWTDVLLGQQMTVQLPSSSPGVSGTAQYWAEFKEERKGMSRLSDIEARLRELEKEAARYARFPKTDEWPVGTVITYNWSPSRNDMAEVYAYAVLKASNTAWYWTGHSVSKKSGGNYDTLVECLAEDGVSDIMIATPEDFNPLFPELTDLMSEEDAAKVEEFLANPETGVKAERSAKTPAAYIAQLKRADG